MYQIAEGRGLNRERFSYAEIFTTTFTLTWYLFRMSDNNFFTCCGHETAVNTSTAFNTSTAANTPAAYDQSGDQCYFATAG